MVGVRRFIKKSGLLSRAVALLLAGAFMLALPPVSAQAYSTGDDYPYQGQSSGVDPWRFINGYCTSFAAWCLNSRNGIDFTNYYMGATWGNANNWKAAAQSVGITVDSNPAVGAIAWTNAGSYGHVSWVSAVNGDYVTVEEYNYGEVTSYNPAGAKNAFNKRTVDKSVYSYIHIADINGTDMPSAGAEGVSGTYMIQGKSADGKALTAVSGGSVIIDTPGFADPGGYSGESLWELTRLSNNTYKIINTAQDKALNATDGGRNIQVCAWNDSAAQHWYIVDCGDGWYKFISKASGCALDIPSDGSNVRQYADNGTDAQRFQLTGLKTVTYDANGGTGAPSSQSAVPGTSLTLSGTAPVHPEYSFLGWATGAGAAAPSYQPGDIYSADQSVTLYAVWDRAGAQAESEPAAGGWFSRLRTYDLRFSDVYSSDWFYSNVLFAYEYGLMEGTSGTAFLPDSTFTLAQGVALAARMNSIYLCGEDSIDRYGGGTWWDPYVDYANRTGIYSGQIAADREATRADFALIMVNALPEELLEAVNTVEDGAIPDVPDAASEVGVAVYALYRAGILEGSDAARSYNPDSAITRAEVAALASRLADPSLRRSFTLTH